MTSGTTIRCITTKSLGILALALALVKIGWQWHTPAPGPVAGLRTWEKAGAKAMHYVLWGMMLLIPVTGYLISTSAGKTHSTVQLV